MPPCTQAQTQTQEMKIWWKNTSALFFNKRCQEVGKREWRWEVLVNLPVLVWKYPLETGEVSPLRWGVREESCFFPKTGEHHQSWNLSADKESSTDSFLPLAILLLTQLVKQCPSVSSSYLVEKWACQLASSSCAALSVPDPRPCALCWATVVLWWHYLFSTTAMRGVGCCSFSTTSASWWGALMSLCARVTSPSVSWGSWLLFDWRIIHNLISWFKVLYCHV